MEMDTLATRIQDIRHGLVEVRKGIDQRLISERADRADISAHLMALHFIREVREELEAIAAEVDTVQADLIGRARRDPVPAPWQLIADQLGASRQSVTKWWKTRHDSAGTTNSA